MAQHFLYSAAAKTLTLAQIFRLTDDQAYDLLKSMRWEGGEPVCPHCGNCEAYEIRTRRIFKCKAKECRRQFSLTSGTLFASYKLPLRDYLAAIALFVNGAKGVSALQMSRELGMAHKSAFVLLHKLREAMAADAPASLGGIVEVDGGWFGGYQREANYKAERVDRRYTYMHGRRAVVVARERGGRTVTDVFGHEADGKDFIIAKLENGAVVHADEGRGWDGLRHHFAMRRVNHTVGYFDQGRLHQPSRVLLLPAAARGDRRSPLHFRLSRSLCSRDGLEGGSPPQVQWRAIPVRRHAGAGLWQVQHLHRLLAAVMGVVCLRHCVGSS